MGTTRQSIVRTQSSVTSIRQTQWAVLIDPDEYVEAFDDVTVTEPDLLSVSDPINAESVTLPDETVVVPSYCLVPDRLTDFCVIAKVPELKM